MRHHGVIAVLFFLCSCKAQESAQPEVNNDKWISATSDSIRVTGRVKLHTDSITVYWPGTSILFRFNGTSAAIVMNDEHGKNYFNIVVDGVNANFLKLKKGVHTYTLTADSAGDHTIELFKRTEWDKGKTVFRGIKLPGGKLLSLPPERKRTIEFYGNSITSGYANEDLSDNDSPDSSLTNNYNSYAAFTARHFDANFYCTSKSGIGIMVSWFPLTMPQLYNRLDPFDSTSRWDFKKVTPQVVVVNLLQNDSWLVKMPEHASFKNRFGRVPPSKEFIIQSYRDFISKIRETYGDATIICLLGPMDITKDGSPWPGYVKEAVEGLKDEKILYHFFPYSSAARHPRVQEHKQVADELIHFIEANVKW